MTPRRTEARDPAWLAAGIAPEGNTGSTLRAGHVLRALVERTGAAIVHSFGRRGLPATAWGMARASGMWTADLKVATARLVPAVGLLLFRGNVHGRLLDLHDHPTKQLEALGVLLSARQRSALDSLVARNVATFDVISVPSASFAELCGLPADRVVVATNGTDAERILRAPPGDEPIVAMVSGAAPGRGIEQLIEAVARLRGGVPEATLRLALAATSPASRAYLANLREDARALPWVTFDVVPYGGLSAWLGRAQVLIIPHPAHPYLDTATPVKLFDGMAAGRPTVSTPRIETARILRRWDAGVITRGDGPDDLGDAIEQLLLDAALRERMGANARHAAVTEYDWDVISNRLADVVLSAN